MGPARLFVRAQMAGELKLQEAFDKPKFKQQTGVGILGPRDSRGELTAVLRSETFGADVTTVDREKRQDFHQRAFEAIERNIGGVTVAARHAFEQISEVLDVTGH